MKQLYEEHFNCKIDKNYQGTIEQISDYCGGVWYIYQSKRFFKRKV